MRAQTRKTLENIRAVLASIGGEMPNVVSLTHYITDIDEFMKTGDIRRQFFSEPFPITTTVQIVRLLRRGPGQSTCRQTSAPPTRGPRLAPLGDFPTFAEAVKLQA
jgi:enamine deaminase RidA (YjgF/YER057c/UK114 family)